MTFRPLAAQLIAAVQRGDELETVKLITGKSFMGKNLGYLVRKKG